MNARGIIERAIGNAFFTPDGNANSTAEDHALYNRAYDAADAVLAALDAEGIVLCRNEPITFAGGESMERYVPIPREDT